MKLSIPVISIRAKEAIKTSLAMVIAFGIALWLNWDRPYWAGFAVAFVSLSTVGQSLNKAALRMAGTIAAVVVSFIILGLFPQDRWLYLAALVAWMGLCTYMAGGPDQQYFWVCAGFIVALITIDAGPNGAELFHTAMMRAQETGLGILVYGLVAIVVWPVRSGARLDSAAKELIVAQRECVALGMSPTGDRTSNEEMRTRVDGLLQLQSGLMQAQGAAIADTFEVWERRASWRELCAVTHRINGILLRWIDGIPRVGAESLRAAFPDLSADAQILETRLRCLESILDGQSPDSIPDSSTLRVETGASGVTSHFEKAEIAALQSLWETLEREVSMALSLAADIRDLALPESTAPARLGSGIVEKRYPALDVERAIAALRTMLIVTAAYLVWIYVPDVPAGTSVVSIGAALGINLSLLPQVRASSIFRPVFVSVTGGSLIYLLVMPGLSTFVELGLLLFGYTFVVCYLFAAPKQALGRALGLAMFLSIASISNDQSYQFGTVSNTALMMAVVCLIVWVTESVVVAPFPENNFRRLLSRYFRSVRSLLDMLGRDTAAPLSLLERVRKTQALHEITTLPGKLSVWGGLVNPDLLPGLSAQSITLLLRDLKLLSFRMQELVDARDQQFSEWIIADLSPDLRAWRLQMAEALMELANPASTGDNVARADVNRLTAVSVENIEARIRNTLERDVSEQLAEKEEFALLRLLAAFRGVADALGRCQIQARPVDWSCGQEERFSW